MALEGGGVDLEVGVPTITKGGNVVEDCVGTSSTLIRKDEEVEDAPTMVSQWGFTTVQFVTTVGGRIG